MDDDHCERCGRGHDFADDDDLDWDVLVDDDGEFEAIVCPDCLTDEELEEDKTSPTWCCRVRAAGQRQLREIVEGEF